MLLLLSVCKQGGMYMLLLLDTYAPTYGVLIIALFECIAIAWVYGTYLSFTLLQYSS